MFLFEIGNKINVKSKQVEDDIERVKKRIMNMRKNREGTVLLVEGGAGLAVDQFKRRLKSSTIGTLGLTKWSFISGRGAFMFLDLFF